MKTGDRRPVMYVCPRWVDLRRLGLRPPGRLRSWGGRMIDLPRLHRFLVEHETGNGRLDAAETCIGCSQSVRSHFYPEDHLPDCEWLALVEMTRPVDLAAAGRQVAQAAREQTVASMLAHGLGTPEWPWPPYACPYLDASEE